MTGAWKLNEEKVLEIKKLFVETTLSNKKIAELYDVSDEHIRQIRKGKRWNEHSRSFYTKETIERWSKEIMEESAEPLLKEKKQSWFRRIISCIVS